MSWKEAIQALGECEQRLRGLVADAINVGDYTNVLRVTELAKAVAALAAEGDSEEPQVGGPTARAEPMETVSSNGRAHAAALNPASSRRTASPDPYPKFFRRGNELVKVGWSKKERKEYNHRAARRSIDAVASS